METTDNELVAEYLDGEIESLEELIARNIDMVYRYAFRMSRDTETASDITQETFVKVWKNIKKFDLDKNFKTWLLGIAHNTAIDFLRKRKDYVFSDFDTENYGNTITETLADTALLPSEIFEHAERRELLDVALSKLPPSQREVVTLYFEDELTFGEIGDILNKPLNTVKSQQRRALASLRLILKDLI